MTNSTNKHAPETSVSQRTHFEIEQFLFEEAALLDGRAYAEWFELLSDDLHYYMPLRVNRDPTKNGGDYLDQSSIVLFDETKETLSLRVNRLILALQTGMVPSENPPPIYRRMVSNVRVKRRQELEENEYEVNCLFTVHRTRLASQVDVFIGGRQDILRRVNGPLGWSIVSRVIHMDVATIPSNNLNTLF